MTMTEEHDNVACELETRRVKSIKEKNEGRIRNENVKQWKEKQCTAKWPISANLKTDMEAIITALQKQAIATNNIKAKVMKSGNNPKCRLYTKQNDAIHHVVVEF